MAKEDEKEALYWSVKQPAFLAFLMKLFSVTVQTDKNGEFFTVKTCVVSGGKLQAFPIL